MHPVDVTVGLSVAFVFYVGAIFLASTRLICRNWYLFKSFWIQPREIRVRMSLWVSIPLMIFGLLWMRGVAIYNFLIIDGIPHTSFFQIMIYMPIILTALCSCMWWLCNRTFEKSAHADLMWLGLVLMGISLGLIAGVLSWLY